VGGRIHLLFFTRNAENDFSAFQDSYVLCSSCDVF
jgi:hypothetical protein